MILEIITYVGSAVVGAGVYAGIDAYRNRAGRAISTPVGTFPKNDIPLGISTVDFSIPEESEEAYLNRLKFIHPEAWKEYQSGYSSRELLIEEDLYINMLLLKAQSGEIEVTVGPHTMDFGDGTELWIGNKYYSYGNIYRSKNRSNMIFTYGEGRYSPYTFLSIVDYEMRATEFAKWKRLHDAYDKNIINKIRGILK